MSMLPSLLLDCTHSLLNDSVYNHGFDYRQVLTAPQPVAHAKTFLLCFDLYVL